MKRYKCLQTEILFIPAMDNIADIFQIRLSNKHRDIFSAAHNKIPFFLIIERAIMYPVITPAMLARISNQSKV